MIRIVVICLNLMVLSSCKNESKEKESLPVEAVTTYYLIRHAEKDRSDSTNTNPALTERGLERAQLWASYFDSIPLDKLYSTNYIRTQQTAQFISENKSLPIEIYDPKTLVTEEFKKKTKGQRILIVGHSNTTPMLVNHILETGTFEDIPDDDNSRLYIIQIKKEKKSANIEKVELKKDTL
ncbi:MAG: phosphoglycerate mutase family protein [Flavobacteriaceae bacterium]